MSNPTLAKLREVTLAWLFVIFSCLLSGHLGKPIPLPGKSLRTVTDHRSGSKLQKNSLLGGGSAKAPTNPPNFMLRRGFSTAPTAALARCPLHLRPPVRHFRQHPQPFAAGLGPVAGWSEGAGGPMYHRPGPDNCIFLAVKELFVTSGSQISLRG